MKNNLPKKLWLLRAYVAFLIGLIELLLTLFVLVSIINLFTEKTLLGDLLLGLGGLYLVTVSLGVLMISQIILLFIGIHDNIDDMRKKALDQNYTVDLVAEKQQATSHIFHVVFLISVIILSIIFSALSLTGLTNGAQKNYKEKALEQNYDSLSNNQSIKPPISKPNTPKQDAEAGRQFDEEAWKASIKEEEAYRNEATADEAKH